MAGAPGSKWSSVAASIYYSDSIDRSDSLVTSQYNTKHVNHIGAYFDPGMQYGNQFDKISDYTKLELEAEFSRPFAGYGIRIIKSHLFSLHLDFIRSTWPNRSIVLVDRPDDACLGWWIKAGGFDITYPNYSYYQDYYKMLEHIEVQNQAIRKFVKDNQVRRVYDNYELSDVLNIDVPTKTGVKLYNKNDLAVYVHKGE